MNPLNRLPIVFAIILAAVAIPLTAAEMKPAPMQGMMGMPMQGMMGQPGHMMMCPMMGGGTGGAMMGRGGLPALPPGNEKLQLQMQAEIMQKVGEIVARYAAQIQSR